MPTYTVRSGDMKRTVETPFEADASIIATIALLDAIDATGLGVIMSVTGGKYVGDFETYVSTEKVLTKMGYFDGTSMVRP